LFGAVLFYTFWEAKSAYSLPFLPFLLMLAEDGAEFIKGAGGPALNRNMQKGILVLMAATLIFSVVHYQDFVSEKQKMYDRNIWSAGDKFPGTIENISAENHVLTQDFYTEDSFDHFALKGEVIEGEDCAYQVRLLSQGKEIDSFVVSQEDIKGKWIEFKTARQHPEGRQQYTIEVSAAVPGQPDSIIWQEHASTAYDEYEGVSRIDGQERSSDLLLKVYKQYKAAYFGKGKYCLAVSLFLLMELFLLFFFRTGAAKEERNAMCG
jgi:hypothetical protein